MNETSRKYLFNETAWSKQTPESCYWGGFIAADGCLRKSGDSYNLKVSLHKKDSLHLEKLKQYCKYTGPIYSEKNDISSLVIYSNNKWNKDLKSNFGITPRKTFTLSPPVFESNFLKECYILGFLDGDGCVYRSEKRRDVSVSCVGGSKSFINWVHFNLIEISKNSAKKRGRVPKVNTDKRSGAFVSTISGAKAEFIIKHFSGFDLPKLERKWNK